jgi:hypothetical protein
MKIIFIDIDGVLTTATWKGFSHFNPVCANLLKCVLKTTDYKLVISSTWRGHGINNDSCLDKELIEHDLKKYLHIDWHTTFIWDNKRGKQIKQWLDEHPETTDYIILDDEPDMLDEQLPRFIKTDAYNGILFEHFEQLQKLSKSKTSDIVILPEWYKINKEDK